VDKVQRAPEFQRKSTDSTEFYVQSAMKFEHEHENFRLKPLKWNGRARKREGKERSGPAWIFCPGSPEFLVTLLLGGCST